MRGKYTVNEVEERTNVPASTLRQWERRYGFPMPERSESGYRMYSERDLRQIEAMKRHIGDGVPASRAADLVQQLGVPSVGPRSVGQLTEEFVEALVALDDERADHILSEAYALHPLETVMLELMQSAISDIGQRWHSGLIRTTTEHFASQYIQGRLRELLKMSPHSKTAAAVIVACAPGDQHEIGALMLAVMLRRAGYRVYYIGADTPVADLAEMAQTVQPVAVMISAATALSVDRLRQEQLQSYTMAPLTVLGGAAFDAKPERAQALGGTYLGSNLVDLVARLRVLIEDVKA